MSPDSLSAAVRALGFCLLFQAVGATFFVVLCDGLLDRSRRVIQRLRLWSALAAAVLVGMHLLLDAARLTDSYAGMLDTQLRSLVFHTTGAASHALQMAGLLVIALSGFGTSVRARFVTIVAAISVVAAFLLTGHTSESGLRALLAPLLLAHLLVVAFWFGSLLPLWLVVRREPLALAARVLRRFSRLAIGLVPSLAVAGVLLWLGLAQGQPDFKAPYGVLVLAKVAGFLLLMGFAAWNKLRLVPALDAGQYTAVFRLKCSLLLETGLIGAVLAITAVLTSFYSP